MGLIAELFCDVQPDQFDERAFALLKAVSILKAFTYVVDMAVHRMQARLELAGPSAGRKEPVQAFFRPFILEATNHL